MVTSRGLLISCITIGKVQWSQIVEYWWPLCRSSLLPIDGPKSCYRGTVALVLHNEEEPYLATTAFRNIIYHVVWFQKGHSYTIGNQNSCWNIVFMWIWRAILGFESLQHRKFWRFAGPSGQTVHSFEKHVYSNTGLQLTRFHRILQNSTKPFSKSFFDNLVRSDSPLF